MSFSMSFQPFQGRYLRVYNQATTLVREGYDVILLAWDRQANSPLEEQREGIHIKRFHIPAGVGRGPHRNFLNLLRFNWNVLRYLMRNEYDVAHCYNLDAVITTLLAAKLRKKRCVLDLCEPQYYAFWDKRFSPLLKLVNFIETALARHYDHVLVHNVFQIDKFKAHGIRHVSQVGSYPNLYMVAEGNDESAPSNKDVVVIGRIGTIYENNGIEELVDAFKRLIERQASRDEPWRYGLFLAGRIYESYEPTFYKLVEPIKDHIELRGAFKSTELHELYKQIDISAIFVRKTTWFENITPTKLFDSMANGVPVVGNDIGEVKQIVEEGPCGVIVDEADPESICAGIERLARQPRLRQHMSRMARQLAKQKYTWEVYRGTFLSLYQYLTSRF